MTGAALLAALAAAAWSVWRWSVTVRALRTDDPRSPRVTTDGDRRALVVPLSSGATGEDLVTIAAAMEAAGHYRTASALYALAAEHTTDEAVFRGVRRCERLLTADTLGAPR